LVITGKHSANSYDFLSHAHLRMSADLISAICSYLCIWYFRNKILL